MWLLSVTSLRTPSFPRASWLLAGASPLMTWFLLRNVSGVPPLEVSPSIAPSLVLYAGLTVSWPCVEGGRPPVRERSEVAGIQAVRNACIFSWHIHVPGASPNHRSRADCRTDRSPFVHHIVHVSNLFGALASALVAHAYIQHLDVLGPLNGGPRHNVFSYHGFCASYGFIAIPCWQL